MTSVKGCFTKAMLQSRKWINGTLVENPPTQRKSWPSGAWSIMNALYTLISIVHSHGSWRTKVDSERGWKSLHRILARAFDKTLVLCATSYSTVLHIWQAYISKQVYNILQNHFNKELISSQTDGSIVIRDDRTDEGCVRNSTFLCNIHLFNRNCSTHAQMSTAKKQLSFPTPSGLPPNPTITSQLDESCWGLSLHLCLFSMCVNLAVVISSNNSLVTQGL